MRLGLCRELSRLWIRLVMNTVLPERLSPVTASHTVALPASSPKLLARRSDASAKNGGSKDKGKDSSGAAAAVSHTAQDDTMRLEGEKRFHSNCARCHAAPPKFAPRVMATIVRHMRGEDSTYWFAPLIADAEAGFGGTLNVFELVKAMIEAGTAGVHLEDQVASALAVRAGRLPVGGTRADELARACREVRSGNSPSHCTLLVRWGLQPISSERISSGSSRRARRLAMWDWERPICFARRRWV